MDAARQHLMSKLLRGLRSKLMAPQRMLWGLCFSVLFSVLDAIHSQSAHLACRCACTPPAYVGSGVISRIIECGIV